MRSQRIQSDPNFELPPKLVALVEKRKGSCPPKSFNQLVDYHVEMATVNFETLWEPRADAVHVRSRWGPSGLYIN